MGWWRRIKQISGAGQVFLLHECHTNGQPAAKEDPPLPTRRRHEFGPNGIINATGQDLIDGSHRFLIQ